MNNLMNIHDILDKWIQEVKLVNTIDHLYRLKMGIFSRSDSFLQQEIGILEHYLILSKVHDALMKKALYLAEERTLQEKIGVLPKRYCWVTMGSGGRREQMIDTDQDNGIIYTLEEEESPEQVDLFVKRLSILGVEYLKRIGYSECKGNVMATNPRWRTTLEGWKKLITSIEDKDSMDDVRFVHIAADFRTIYGDEQLGEELRDWMINKFRQNYVLLNRFAQYSLTYEIPMGFFGQFYTIRWGRNAGKVDLKFGAYIPWVNIIRWFALYNGIQETSTIERLKKLTDNGEFTKSDYARFHQRLTALLALRFNHPENFLNPKTLTEVEKKELKEILRKVIQLRKRMKVLLRKTRNRRGGDSLE